MVLEDPDLASDAMLRAGCIKVALCYEHLDAQHPRL